MIEQQRRQYGEIVYVGSAPDGYYAMVGQHHSRQYFRFSETVESHPLMVEEPAPCKHGCLQPGCLSHPVLYPARGKSRQDAIRSVLEADFVAPLTCPEVSDCMMSNFRPGEE